jgi:hypothetical protein
MPINLTDVDEFTDPVAAPDDTDPGNGTIFQLAPQALANRTRNLKNRTETLEGAVATSARYQFANGAVSDPLTLSENFADSGYVLSANTVQVPAPGKYRVSWSLRISTTSITNPVAFGLTFRVGGNIAKPTMVTRFSDDDSWDMDLSDSIIVNITTPATQTLSFTPIGAGLEVSNVTGRNVSIHRVSV